VLDFPNQSRFFDPTRCAVRFWGHNHAMEWSFFVTATALKKLQSSSERDEVSLLRAFDANREKIYAAASKAFGRGRKGSYELDTSDFE
jgi:Protein of unknown function (DUF1488)